MGTNQGAKVPTLYRPVRVMVTELALVAVVLGVTAGALGDALHAADAFFITFFITILISGLVIFGWITSGLCTYVSDDPVDLGVDESVDWLGDEQPWLSDDHHTGEC